MMPCGRSCRGAPWWISPRFTWRAWKGFCRRKSRPATSIRGGQASGLHAADSGGTMSHAGRLIGRLFSLGLSCLLVVGTALAQSPALTTVSDTVYRADGTLASRPLLISWPALTPAEEYAV